MNRLDEMIYHVEQQAKLYEGFAAAFPQIVKGKERQCCAVCGHCPEAEAELLRAIRDELTGEHKASKKASPTSRKDK